MKDQLSPRNIPYQNDFVEFAKLGQVRSVQVRLGQVQTGSPRLVLVMVGQIR